MSAHFLRMILLLAALVMLAGCPSGGDDDDDSSTPEDPTDPGPQDPVIGPLEKLFGTAPGDEGDFDDVLTYFNQITPENQGKWGSVEGARDVMSWASLDAAYDFAQNNELAYKHHTLIWGQQQPTWMDSLSPEEQLEEIDEWMSELAVRYPNLDMIDVVNEPLHAPPSYKDALGGDGVTGYDWMIKAFEMAREHFPNAQLLLNDYQILHLEANTAEYLALIELLQDRDLIDAIGLEAHFLEKTAPAMVKINLDTLATTGLPIYITEFDLDIEDDAEHANVMSQLFPVFWEHGAVEGVTHWGHRAGSVWKDHTYLLNADGTERPALEWLVCYLNGEAECAVPELVFDGWQGTAAGLVLEAESYDQGEGIVAIGEVTAYTNGGDWIAFHDVEFQGGWDTLEVRYSKGVDDGFPATITVHLGSLDNPVWATVSLPPTGAWDTFNTVEVSWDATTDTQDVYISFNTDEEAEAVGNLDKISFISSTAVPDDGDNLVTDGGFEGLALNGWQSWNGSTLELSTAQKYAGSQSLLATNRPDNTQFAVYNLTGKVNPDTIYTVSARVYQDGAAVDTVRLAAKVDCTDATDPPLHSDFPWLHNHTSVNPSEWTQLSANLVIPDCDLVDVAILFEGTTAGVDVYIDDVKVLPPVAGANLITDGGFESDSIGAWHNFGNGSSLDTTTDEADEGTYSMVVTGLPLTGGYAGYNLTSLVEDGTNYTVSARVMHNGVAIDGIRLAARVTCATPPIPHNEFPWLQDNQNIAPNTWTTLTNTLAIPASCGPQEIQIYFEGDTDQASSVYIDEVSVVAQ